MMDGFFLCAPGGKPRQFYLVDAGSAKSSLMVQALNRLIETPIVTITAVPDTKGRKPDLSPLRG